MRHDGAQRRGDALTGKEMRGGGRCDGWWRMTRPGRSEAHVPLRTAAGCAVEALPDGGSATRAVGSSSNRGEDRERWITTVRGVFPFSV
ncbi:hypothetical protein SESBI_12946 [Sesbania bispinosa]|nr:hypothetical protein SESBI_12946 [Sesbania bispinosa]